MNVYSCAYRVEGGAHGALRADTPTTLSREVERFEVLDASRIRVTSSDGHEEIVSDLVLACPVPNVRSHWLSVSA